jgi:hypothetical protein
MVESFAIFDARPSVGSFRSHRQSAATASACRKPRNKADYRSGRRPSGECRLQIDRKGDLHNVCSIDPAGAGVGAVMAHLLDQQLHRNDRAGEPQRHWYQPELHHRCAEPDRRDRARRLHLLDQRGAGWARQRQIARAKIDGTDVDQNFITAGGPAGVAVEGKHIYWTNDGETGALGGGQSIGRAKLDATYINQSFIIGASHSARTKYAFGAGGDEALVDVGGVELCPHDRLPTAERTGFTVVGPVDVFPLDRDSDRAAGCDEVLINICAVDLRPPNLALPSPPGPTLVQ